MGATVHPHSLTARGYTAGAAVLRAACASSTIRINPAYVAKPPAAAAVAKKLKRPGSLHQGAPSPAKRARGACGEVQPDAGTQIEGRPAGPPLRKGVVEALCVTKNQQASPEVAPAPAKSPACSSMRELLERARLAKARSAAAPAAAEADAEAVCRRRREIEMLRAQARREIELVVRTVEFNDPFIDFQDAFK